MAGTCVAEGHFAIRFDGEGLISAELLAQCLSGWGGLYGRVPAILAGRHPAFAHVCAAVYVDEIEQGSLWLKAMIRLLAKDAEAAERIERSVREIADCVKREFWDSVTRMNPAGKHIVSAAVGGAIALGAAGLMGYFDEADRSVINASHGSIVNQGAIYFGTSPTDFSGILERTTKRRARLTRDTIAALRPAQPLSSGSVCIDPGETNLVVDAGAAKIIARTNYEDLHPRIETRRLARTAISVRALDLDRKTSGWAAIFPDVSARRIRASLASGVRITSTGTYLVDAEIDMEVDLDGNETPIKARILSVHENGR